MIKPTIKSENMDGQRGRAFLELLDSSLTS